MAVIGAMLLLASIPLIFYAGLGILTFLIGGLLIAYGEHYWTKVSIIMWTRQALREYGAVSTHTPPPPSPAR